jgi:hypothetical protein
MREQGRTCGIVERFNHYGGKFGIRQDLFGLIDIIALDPVDGVIGIQSCGQAFSEHVKKMTEERNEEMFEWLKHAKVELWGWRKVLLRRGGSAERWTPRVMDFWLEQDVILWKERGK